jgi:replicative DNA helicase
MRKLLLACQGIERKIMVGGDCNVIMDEAERDVLGVMRSSGLEQEHDSRALVTQVLDTIEGAFNRQGAVVGLSTGFHGLDKMTGGLHPGEMFVLAARPSQGKTSLAMNVAEHVALGQGKSVGVFSLEMTAKSLMQRMVCSRAGLDLARVRDGRLNEADFPKLATVAGAIGASSLHIDDASGLTILQLRAKARRWHQRFGLALLVVDYLQLIRSPRHGDRREREVADVSQGLKALSKELGVPVLVLSQLNRGVERERDGKPKLSDLRESGAIEQDADAVALLSVDTASLDECGPYDGIPMTLNLAKQRNGPTGTVKLVFHRGHTRFEDAE